MPSIQNVDVGVCSVIFGGVNLGHTKGGVVFRAERSFEDLSVDQYGDSAVDMVLTGQNATIEVPLAEPTVSNLNVAIPEGEHAQAGSGATLKERLGIGSDAGDLLRQYAQTMVLHPVRYGATDLAHDITLYKVVSTDVVELGFRVDEQRILRVLFRAFIDETYGSGRRLGHIGYANIS